MIHRCAKTSLIPLIAFIAVYCGNIIALIAPSTASFVRPNL